MFQVIFIHENRMIEMNENMRDIDAPNDDDVRVRKEKNSDRGKLALRENTRDIYHLAIKIFRLYGFFCCC